MSDSDILAATPEQHLHDLRAVYDMANLRLQSSADTGESPWSVLQIVPEPHSGSETSIGVARNIETGELVDVATGKPLAPGIPVQPGTIEEGSWTVIAGTGARKGEPRGHYKWTLPTDYSDRKMITPDDIYRPLSRGGNVLCRHNPQVEGVGQFDSVSLLPSGWETQVQPALAALQQDDLLSKPLTSDSVRTSLTKLLASDNSITSSVAFRSLNQTGNLDPGTIQQTISSAFGYRRAVMMYVALALAPAPGAPSAEPAFAPSVQGSASPQENRSTALALAAVAIFHKGSASATLSVALLNGMRSRSAPSVAGEFAPLVAEQASDPYVEELLKTAQLM